MAYAVGTHARGLLFLELHAKGHSDREIAAATSYSRVTIRLALMQIRAELGARNRAHAACIALKRGLIGGPDVKDTQGEISDAAE